MAGNQRIAAVWLDEVRAETGWNPAIVTARTMAMARLLDDNSFLLRQMPAAGPYNLSLSVLESRLRLEVSRLDGMVLETVILPLRPFQSLLDAANTGNMAELVHLSESAARLQQLLSEQVALDHGTAQRLFTLIYILHIRE